MWHNLDFSKLNITFRIENTEFRLVQAKRTLFHEDFPNHMHSFFELHYICGGEGILLTNQGSYPLSDGTLYLIPPKTFHEQLTEPQNLMEEYSFSFDIKKVKGEYQRDVYTLFSEAPFFLLEENRSIAPFFYVLDEEATEKKTGYRYMIQSTLQQIIVLLVRQLTRQAPSVQKQLDLLSDRRKFIIDETLIYQYKDITLERLSEYLNLSIKQTARTIKKEYGMTFSELRTRSRLNAACPMLTHSDFPIHRIAELVGYDNAIYFTTRFKEQFGCTPATYRKNNRRKND